MKDGLASDISDLAIEINGNNREKGFYDRQIPQIDRLAAFCANVTGEVSELWEAARKNKLGDQCDKDCDLSCFEEEMADIIIRTLDTAGFYAMDIGRAIAIKLAYNKTRERCHGGKLA